MLTPENHLKKNTRLINLPLVRIKATNKFQNYSPIFLLNGGPGRSNFQKHLLVDELTKKHDLVILGYRGVEGEVVLNCNKQNNKNVALALQPSVEDCIAELQIKNIDIEAYSVSQIVEDIELTRQKLNYPKISFLAFSFGTLIAQEYAKKYPQNVDKQFYIAPRPENNLQIDPLLLNKKLCVIYKNYTRGTLHLKNSEILDKLQEAILKLKNTNRVNTNSFFLYVFSQLYSTQTIVTFFDILRKENTKKNQQFNKSYNYFSENFCKKIVWGDMYLKKQGKIKYFANKHTEIKNTPGFLIAKVVNEVYNPPHIQLECKTDFIGLKMQMDLFCIFGEFDVASPYELWQQNNNLFNGNYKILPKTAHFDYFLEQKEVIDSLINNYF